MPPLAIEQHVAAVVARGVIDHDNFVRRRALRRDRLDRARQVLGMVVVRQDDREQGLAHAAGPGRTGDDGWMAASIHPGNRSAPMLILTDPMRAS